MKIYNDLFNIIILNCILYGFFYIIIMVNFVFRGFYYCLGGKKMIILEFKLYQDIIYEILYFEVQFILLKKRKKDFF